MGQPRNNSHSQSSAAALHDDVIKYNLLADKGIGSNFYTGDVEACARLSYVNVYVKVSTFYIAIFLYEV